MKYTEEELSNLFICNIIDKRKEQGFSNHCKNVCGHGLPHEKNDCTGEEFCGLHKSGNIIKIRCRKLKKKEIKEILKNE